MASDQSSKKKKKKKKNYTGGIYNQNLKTTDYNLYE